VVLVLLSWWVDQCYVISLFVRCSFLEGRSFVQLSLGALTRSIF